MVVMMRRVMKGKVIMRNDGLVRRRVMMVMMMLMMRMVMMMEMMMMMMMIGFHNYGDAASPYRFHLQSDVATPSHRIVIIIIIIIIIIINIIIIIINIIIFPHFISFAKT